MSLSRSISQSRDAGVRDAFLLGLGHLLSRQTNLNLLQTGYVLYMRRAKTTTKLSEWGMAFYNNLLCIFLMLLAAGVSGELADVHEYPMLTKPNFIAAMVFGGVLGTGLSLSVFWCVSATSPTTYSMVGAMNKIPITFISVLFFHVVMDWKMIVSVCIGLSSGTLSRACPRLPTPCCTVQSAEYSLVSKCSSLN